MLSVNLSRYDFLLHQKIWRTPWNSFSIHSPKLNSACWLITFTSSTSLRQVVTQKIVKTYIVWLTMWLTNIWHRMLWYINIKNNQNNLSWYSMNILWHFAGRYTSYDNRLMEIYVLMVCGIRAPKLL